MTTTFTHKAEKASAILMVLWGLMLMSFAIMGLIQYMQFSLDEDLEAAKEFQARLMAESGLVVQGHPKVDRFDPVLHQEISATRGYDVEVKSEGGKIAINQINQNPEIAEYCRRLFELWHVDANEVEIIVDSLRDWVDQDDRPRPAGAEEGFYQQRNGMTIPRNKEFLHLDELLFVRGMAEIALRKLDWQDYFTLYGKGLIDVNHAPADLLEVVCEVGQAQAAQLVLERYGPDLVPETEDDALITDFEKVEEALALDREDFAKVQARLTLNHPIVRVESRGFAGDFTKTLVAIVGDGIQTFSEE